MKKLFINIILSSSLLLFLSAGVFAQQESRGRRGNEPTDVFENVAGETNDGLQIQENALNDVAKTDGHYAYKSRIANTLDSVRTNIAPYLNRIVYIGLSLAVILIIYNGFMLMLGGLSNRDHKTTITNIKNIAIGIGVLMGFWIIIKFAMVVINAIAGK